MIRVLVTDGDGTLQFPNPPSEVRLFLEFLAVNKIIHAVISNNRRATVERRFANAGLPTPEILITPEEVQVTKPSPRFIEEIIRKTGVQPNEIVLLGDDDKTDIFCAINARILPLRADYSNAPTPRVYGIPVTSIKSLQDYISSFGRQSAPYFGWHFQSTCPDLHIPIDIRVLIFDQGEKSPTFKKVLKEGADIYVGAANTNVKSLLFHYLVSQCYYSGLVSEIDTITVYPGHLASKANPTIESFSRTLSLLFKQRFSNDILIRHKDAPQSRYQGTNRNIFDQFNTIHVNKARVRYIKGSRILVLDDFTTSGFSLETARRMLMAAGASSVVGLATAKFRATQAVTRIAKTWDAFAPCTLRQEDIVVQDSRGIHYVDADAYFHNVVWKYYTIPKNKRR